MEIVIDLSESFGQVSEQGERGTCLVFATTSAHEYLHNLNQPLCVEWLYYYASIAQGKSLKDIKKGKGTDIPEVLSVLQDLGQPFEYVWPYTDDPNLQIWEPPQNPKPRFYAFGTYSSFKLNEELTSLDIVQPVVITCWAKDELLSPEYKGGLAFVDVDPSNSAIASHTILVVGYGFVDKDVYLKVRNSWGDQMGK